MQRPDWPMNNTDNISAELYSVGTTVQQPSSDITKPLTKDQVEFATN